MNRTLQQTVGRPLFGHPTAIHVVIGACDIPRLMTAQEQRQSGQIFGLDKLLGRLAHQHHIVDHLFARHPACFHRIGDLILDQRRPDITGADAVCGNAMRRQFQRKRLGQPCNAVLG